MIKLRSVTGAVLLAAVSLTLVAGCSRERIDWKSAESADTQEAYDHFLQLHPDSALATQAHTRLAQIAEDKDWQHASAADTADAYKQFLAQHASGKWAEEARIRMENFTLDSNASPTAPPSADTGAVAPKNAPGNSASPAVPGESATRAASPAPAAAPKTPASKPTAVAQATPAAPAKTSSPPPHTADKPALVTHTSGPPSKPVVTSSAETASFGIQLGAFSSQAAALKEWKRLQTTYDSELHGLFAHAVPVQVTSGKLFRLQSPVGEEARARSICSSLTQHAQPCVVVLPPENR